MMENKVKYLFLKELKSYFKSPLGHVFIVIFLFAIGYLTFELGRGSFFYLREASLSPFFPLHALDISFFNPRCLHAIVGRGEKIGNDRAFADHAHYHQASGDCQVSCRLGLYRAVSDRNISHDFYSHLPG